MKYFVFALLLGMSQAHEDKIINGYEVPEGLPQMVNLKKFGNFICAGSLLSSEYVLTAAHCVTNPTYITVTAGDVRINSDTDDGTEVTAEVSRVYNHPDYNSHTKENSISLLKLTSPIERNGLTIDFAKLPVEYTNNQYPIVGQYCTIYGWGMTKLPSPQIPEEISESSGTLMAADLPVVSNEECNGSHSYNGAITDDMLCLGYMGSGGIGSCEGDDGGPALCDGYLFGISSWRTGCVRPYFPGVFTRVNLYTSWILDIIGDV